jgi:hypothetical protein
MSHANDDSCTSFSRKKVKKATVENAKGKNSIDKNNHVGRSTTFESTASGSSISFSSSSSKDATATNNKNVSHEKQPVVNESVIPKK